MINSDNGRGNINRYRGLYRIDLHAKRHGPVVSTPASYSLGPRFKSQPLTNAFRGFLQFLQANVRIHQSNGPYRSLASSVRFRNSSFLWCGVVSPTPNPQSGGPGLRIYDPRRQGAQLYPRALGSSGTSGVPLPVPTIVGPWGEM
jgi:hypothetical protein